MNPSNSRHAWWIRAGRFAAALFVLQQVWSFARGTWLERAVIDHATVGTAVALIHRMVPSLTVAASGSRIVAAGGGINVLNGCEGTEVLFLLFAALAAAPISLRARLLGAVLGTGWVFALNQCRLVLLFFSYRNDRVLFDQLHGVVAPLILVAMVLLFFQWLIRWDGRQSAALTQGAA